MLSSIDIIGGLAASCTTLSFVPQVLKVWSTRSGADISTPMYAVFILGLAFWLAYGVLLQAWPVIIANTVTIVLASAVLILKLYFDRLPVR